MLIKSCQIDINTKMYSHILHICLSSHLLAKLHLFIIFFIYDIYFRWIAPMAARNAVSLYEGASPRVTGFELRAVDQ